MNGIRLALATTAALTAITGCTPITTDRGQPTPGSLSSQNSSQPFIQALDTTTGPPPAAPIEDSMRQQILDRFTADIWPAIAARNHDVQAISVGEHFARIIDPTLAEARGDFGPIQDTVLKLGQKQADPVTGQANWNDGLHFSHAEVTAVTHAESAIASLTVCYTYTHRWNENTAGRNDLSEPAASQMTAELSKSSSNGDWFLHKIADDHVVPACENRAPR